MGEFAIIASLTEGKTRCFENNYSMIKYLFFSKLCTNDQVSYECDLVSLDGLTGRIEI